MDPQPSSIGAVTKPRATTGYDGGDTVIDETTRVRRVRCRAANEASLKQVVAKIVSELQVTLLKPWRGRPHVFFVGAQLALCTDVGGQRCTSTDPDSYCLVVTAPLSPSKKQSSSWSSHVADLVDLHTLVAEHGDVSHDSLMGVVGRDQNSTWTAGGKARSTVGNTADSSPGPREPSREGSRDAGTSERVCWSDIGIEAELPKLEFDMDNRLPKEPNVGE